MRVVRFNHRIILKRTTSKSKYVSAVTIKVMLDVDVVGINKDVGDPSQIGIVVPLRGQCGEAILCSACKVEQTWHEITRAPTRTGK